MINYYEIFKAYLESVMKGDNKIDILFNNFGNSEGYFLGLPNYYAERNKIGGLNDQLVLVYPIEDDGFSATDMLSKMSKINDTFVYEGNTYFIIGDLIRQSNRMSNDSCFCNLEYRLIIK